MVRSRHDPPVLLDRDGTIIFEMKYLRDPDRVALEEGVFDAFSICRNGVIP